MSKKHPPKKEDTHTTKQKRPIWEIQNFSEESLTVASLSRGHVLIKKGTKGTQH